MEDFGYSRQKEESAASSLVKRAFLIGASLFSLACFVYVTINAYYYFSQDGHVNIETIKAEVDPIKVVENEDTQNSEEGIKIDSSIYEDIFGNRKTARDKDVKIRESASPALPPKNDVAKKPEIAVAEKPAVVEKSSANSADQKIIVYSDKAPEKDRNILLDAPKVEKKPEKTSYNKKYIRVQIAALTSKKAAKEYWGRLQKEDSGLFSGLKAFVEQVDLGRRGIFYRLQIGNFFDQVRAEEFCNKYIVRTKKTRADCIVVE